MITRPEQELNRHARDMLVAAHIEVGDDVRSYAEIAQSLGLIAASETVQPVLPQEQTTL